MDITYAPQIFNVPNEKIARQIILTPEFGHSTDFRWSTETPYLAELLAGSLGLTEDMLVVDYGCGIGRLSKALIERTGCRVLGVDISPNMRLLSLQYVESDRFSVISPDLFAAMAGRGLACDAFFSVWVLQHCFDPAQDIDLLHRTLKAGGRGVVINNRQRAVPTHEAGWIDDGRDVLALLGERFAVDAAGTLSAEILTPQAVAASFAAALRKA